MPFDYGDSEQGQADADFDEDETAEEKDLPQEDTLPKHQC
jgi:hypothetical protein